MRGGSGHQYAHAWHLARSANRLLRVRRERPSRRAAEQRDELAPFQLVELHSMPASQAGLQDIELAGVSQELLGRFYNLPLVANSAR